MIRLGLQWLTNSIELLENFIGSHVVLAPLLLLFVEEAGIPLLLPGDSIIAYTGYSLAKTNQQITY